jgi:hypothetical protein
VIAGQKLADPRRVIVVLELLLVVGFLYVMYQGSPGSGRGVTAILISLLGAHAAFDGSTLAMREYQRAQAGHVTMGVVVDKLSSTGAAGSRRIRGPRGRRSRRSPLSPGFTFHEELARVVVTGSLNEWVIEYRYACDAPYRCLGRDFVPEALWRRLHTDQNVNVLQARTETRSARLDENPQRATAAAHLSIAAVLLFVAAVVSGRLTMRRPRGYLTAPAVVTAVEPVTYLDAKRWRVRFAYFDPHGTPQESADEVVTAGWKPGDGCVAVFRPERPDIATFQPRPAA